jgi:hypothetical protein
VAAIPDAGGARCAPRGVLRALPWAALLRVAVLGGLVIAGWLLGSGIGQAQEELAPQDVGQQDNIVQLVGFPLPDDDSEGALGAPSASSTVKSTVTGVLRAVPVPRLPLRPPQVPVLAPVLAPVSKLVAPAPVTRSHAQSQPTTQQVMVGSPPAEPTVRPATVAPAPVHTVRNATPAAAACTAAHPVADPLADQVADPSVEKFSAPGSGPAAPAPASPFGAATAPCPSGSTGSGGVTGGAQPVTMSDGVSGMDPASMYCLRCADLSGMPLAAAQRPSTSPD